MFIDATENRVALRQEGNVYRSKGDQRLNVALLMEGDLILARVYKHCPPGGGPLRSRSRL